MRQAGSITFVAGGLLVFGAWAVGTTGLPDTYRALTEVLAEPLALLLVLLAWRFRRSRLALAALLVALTNLLVRGLLDAHTAGDLPTAHAALAVLLPINLGVVVLLRDHPLPRLATVIHGALIAIQPVVVAGLLHAAGRVDWSAVGEHGWLRLVESQQASLLAFLIAGVFTALAFAARRGTFEVGILWVLVACSVSLLGDRDTSQSTLLMVSAQLVLLFALVEDSYRLAYHDELTGMPGRRALDETMRLLDGDFAIAMVDVDHFKKFNDRYGHDAGDQALRMVADELSRIGGGGRAYRYGGEEFAVLFPGTQASDARNAVDDLRIAIANREFAIRSTKRPRKKPESPVKPKNPVERVKLTVSAGVAGRTLKNPDSGTVLLAADAALYRAKRRGRNRVVAEGVRAKPRPKPKQKG